MSPPPLAFSSSSSDASSSSSSSPPSDHQPLQYSLNSKVMVAATLILCIVVVFVVSLHVYAKWFWRRGRAASAAGGARWRLHRRHLPAEFADVLSTPVPPAFTGLDPATIASLPVFVHQGPSPKPRDAAAAAPLLECAVCLSEFQSLEKGRLLPDCKHRFHVSCIDAWLRSHSTCPLCRLPVSPPRHFEHRTCAQPNHPIPFPATPFLAQIHDQLATAQSFNQSASSVAANLRSQEQPSGGLAPSVAGVHLQGHHRTQTSAAVDRRGEAEASSKSMADGFCETSSSTKAASQFQQQGAGASIVRCHSFGALSRPLEDADASALQPAKSRSFHKSIRWFMSRDSNRGKGRIFPSAGEGTEQENRQPGQRSSSTELPV